MSQRSSQGLSGSNAPPVKEARALRPSDEIADADVRDAAIIPQYHAWYTTRWQATARWPPSPTASTWTRCVGSDRETWLESPNDPATAVCTVIAEGVRHTTALALIFTLEGAGQMGPARDRAATFDCVDIAGSA